jgi:hypothetical protein
MAVGDIAADLRELFARFHAAIEPLRAAGGALCADGNGAGGDGAVAVPTAALELSRAVLRGVVNDVAAKELLVADWVACAAAEEAGGAGGGARAMVGDEMRLYSYALLSSPLLTPAVAGPGDTPGAAVVMLQRIAAQVASE